MFTELGLKTQKEAKEFGLNAYYDEYMGNFQFSENELFENMNKVLMWLESHEDYAVIFQKMEEYEGRNWFLTPQNTL